MGDNQFETPFTRQKTVCMHKADRYSRYSSFLNRNAGVCFMCVENYRIYADRNF